MATKPKYLTAQADWRRKYIQQIRDAEARGDDREAEIWDRRLALEEQYLRDSIKLMRKFAHGYTPEDGFDLNQLAYIPESRLKKVRAYAPIIRKQTSATTEDERGREQRFYKVVRPRSTRGRHAVEQFTGQTEVPDRKAWTVPVRDPKRDTVQLVRKEVVVRDARGRRRHVVKEQVEVTEKRGRTLIHTRYFRFDETPLTFDDVIAMTRAMLPHMPKGWYVIETSNFGAISVPMRKDLILRELQSRFLVYDHVPERGQKDSRGLAETVIGFKLVSTRAEDADREYDERLTRREEAQRFYKTQRERMRRQALKRLRRRII